METEANHEGRHLHTSSHFSQLRGLFSLMSRMLTHPASVDLRALDHIRRMLDDSWNRNNNNIGQHGDMPGGVGGGANNVQLQHGGNMPLEIPLLTAEEVLRRVQSVGAGAGGGLNRDTARSVTNVALMKRYGDYVDELEQLPIHRLGELTTIAGLPMPMTFKKTYLSGSIAIGTKKMLVQFKPEKNKQGVVIATPASKNAKIGPLSALIQPCDILQLRYEKFNEILPADVNMNENENEKNISSHFENIQFEAVQITDNIENIPNTTATSTETSDSTSSMSGYINLACPWIDSSVTQAPVYKRGPSHHKQPYIELLGTEFLPARPTGREPVQMSRVSSSSHVLESHGS
eukprot:gene6991-14216_t